MSSIVGNLSIEPNQNGWVKFKLNKIAEADKFFDKVLLLDSSYKETIDVFKTDNR